MPPTTTRRPPWAHRTFSRFYPGSIRASIIILINSALGAGILTLPYAMKLSGILLGSVALILASFASCFTAYVLFRSISLSEKSCTYSSITKELIGKKVAFLVDVVIALNGLGVSISMFVFLGDFLPEMLGAFELPSLLENRAFLLTMCALIMWPMTIQRRLGRLHGVSFACLLALFAVCVCVSIKAPRLYFASEEKPLLARVNWDSGKCYNIFIFAFSQHMNACTIAEELVNPTEPRSRKVVLRAVILEALLYLDIAYAGYLSFLHTTKEDFISNYPLNDFSIWMCRVALSFCMLIIVPINSIACARSILLLWRKLKKLIGLAGSRRASSDDVESSQRALLAGFQERLIEHPRERLTEFSASQGDVMQDSFSSDDVLRMLEETYGDGSLVEECAESAESFSNTEIIIVATLIVLTGYFVAIITNNVATVSGFIGGTLSTSLVFLFPAMLYFYGPIGMKHSRSLRVTLFSILLLLSLAGYLSTFIMIVQSFGYLQAAA